MDTPVRRMTRSQLSGLGPSSAVKPPGRAASSTKKRDVPRVPFTDLTNDSPISGLMPAKMAANSTCVYESTPRSKLRPADRPLGEDLLRMQVTTLLRKVESEALEQQKSVPCVSDLFESPMRLAAPTPANTPATSGVGLSLAAQTVAQETKPTILPIVIASPICTLDVSPAFVSTAELLSSIDEVSFNVNGGVGTEQQQQQQPTTRTLQFDSPEKRVAGMEELSAPCVNVDLALRVAGSTPGSVSTSEILFSIEASSQEIEMIDGNDTDQAARAFNSPEMQGLPLEGKPITRILRFESPEKRFTDVEILNGVLSPGSGETDEEDSWSVIVNVNSPGKIEGGDNLPEIATTPEADVETLQFLDNVLVDPERRAMPPLWERRDTPARPKGEIKDDDDYEDCEQYDDDDYEGEQEADEDGSEAFDDACEELCKGISHINMGEGESTGLPAFQGKHTRFHYNSDDEIEEDVVTDRTVDSPSKMRLNGYPTPKGKHLRFNDGADSDEEE